MRDGQRRKATDVSSAQSPPGRRGVLSEGGRDFSPVLPVTEIVLLTTFSTLSGVGVAHRSVTKLLWDAG